MPRQHRTWTAGAGAHVISRFVDRRYYLADNDDRRNLLTAMAKAHTRWDWSWLSFALMSSHVHYGALATESSPARFFASAHTRFAQQFHKRRSEQTLGPVFADRPKLIPVAPEGLLRMVAYHHRNPVEAAVVERPDQSPWTSHRAYLRLDPPPVFLDVEWALAQLGFDDTAAGRGRFDEAVMDLDLRAVPRAPKPTVTQTKVELDWSRLVALSRQVAKLADARQLSSKSPDAVVARALAATVAIRDFGQPRQVVADVLGMKAGSVSNLLSSKEASIASQAVQLRQLLISELAGKGGNDE